jgi:hypothetical protein
LPPGIRSINVTLSRRRKARERELCDSDEGVSPVAHSAYSGVAAFLFFTLQKGRGGKG